MFSSHPSVALPVRECPIGQWRIDNTCVVGMSGLLRIKAEGDLDEFEVKTIEVDLEIPCPSCGGAAGVFCTLCGNQGYVTQASLRAYQDMIESAKREISRMPGFTSFSEDDQSSEPVQYRSARCAPRWLCSSPAGAGLHTPDEP